MYHNGDIFSSHTKILSLAAFTEIPAGILKKKRASAFLVHMCLGKVNWLWGKSSDFEGLTKEKGNH